MNNHFATKLLSLAFLGATVASAQSTPPRKDIPTIAKAANGAVVSIVMSDKDGNPIAQGSGFLVSRDGLIVTNYHVIAEGSSALVKLPDGAFYVVDGVLAFDKARDVAIIKAHGENFRRLALGDSDHVEVGQEVVAIGNPLSLESTVSNGIVSGIRTDEELGGKFLQVTTPISPGSSGGPLFNMEGEVVGITTMYIKGGENLNFAIPVDEAKRLLLTKSSKLQGFPNEPESAETQKHDEDTPPSGTTAAAQSNPSDRDYYQQLYDAGGFSEAPPEYVCFSDDAHSGAFFTFTAFAYDQSFDNAWNMLEFVTTHKDSGILDVEKEKENSISTMNSIHEKMPYVTFLWRDIMNSLPADTQTFYRNGGRTLYEAVYQKGVKTNALEYEWDGSAWLFSLHPADPNIYPQLSRVEQLSIEPTTMRYLDSLTVTTTDGTGDPKASSTQIYGPFAGVCEKVPPKVPKD